VQSIKRFMYAKNNRVWSIEQTTPVSPYLFPFINIIRIAKIIS